jgi:hypothetical protein
MLAGGFLFWLGIVEGSGGTPLSQLALIRRGFTTQGVITESWGDPEDGYGAKYTFQLLDGRVYDGKADGKHGNDGTRITVEYLPDDPTINRIKGEGSLTIKDWLWRQCGLGGLLLIMFLAPGMGMLSGIFTRKPEA